jgi:phosphotransferase system  glucose/maltose/N-acetylglucosamine-specific IIC component
MQQKERLNMPNLEWIGRWIMIAGGVLVMVGAAVWLLSKIPWLSQLPGTLRIEGKGFTCIFPVLAMIILSVVLTLVLNIVALLINHK